MAEVDCSGSSWSFFGEGDADLLGVQQRQELLLVGEVGAGRVAGAPFSAAARLSRLTKGELAR
jgi:hypothetical protein